MSLYSEIRLGNEREIVAGGCNIDEPEIHYTKQRQPVSGHYLLYASIYVTFWKGQNYRVGEDRVYQRFPGVKSGRDDGMVLCPDLGGHTNLCIH